ncbi:MAG: spermidine synthase, partial [Acidobacteriota bacterium]
MDPPSPQQGSGPDRRAARQTAVLKAAVFATGFCGIVAEYAMATLASYMMGEAVLQWTLVLSLMLFTMGVGSRVSRWVEGHLADTFVAAELVLSLLVAASAPVAYLLSAWIEPIGLVIYPMAGGVGFLIGLEIPLATRLNERFEELRLNVASMFEKDYYGALAGGLVFAFVALPHLGLTLTPVALGMVNFAVAAALAWVFWPLLVYRRAVAAGLLGVAAALVALAVAAEPVVQFGEQRKYRDRVVHHEQSRFQRIVLTRWKDHHWLYLDGNQQFSSFDEERYHEPLVHPALAVAPSRRRVLILGGGDGLAAREVLRYDDVESVVLVDLDPAMTDLGRTHPVLTELNEGAFEDPRLTVENRDANGYLESTETAFDVIL